MPVSSLHSGVDRPEIWGGANNGYIQCLCLFGLPKFLGWLRHCADN